MPKEKFVDHKFKPEALAKIARANQIITEWAAKGFSLSVRQAYYQFVSRGWLPNTQTNYKNLANLISDARLAGLIDWTSIEDRTRGLVSRSHWATAGGIVDTCVRSFGIDLWEGQKNHVECYVEKEALENIVARACKPWDVAYLSCRGYTSQSEMYRCGKRLQKAMEDGKQPIILHLGDHDPSGMHMTEDLRSRLNLLSGSTGSPAVEVRRLALNMNQIQQYHPPPNPAKQDDPRFVGYMAAYGVESWELDALDPDVIVSLIDGAVEELVDIDQFNERKQEEYKMRLSLKKAAVYWDLVEATVKDKYLAKQVLQKFDKDWKPED